MKTTKPPGDFWCDRCRRWTVVHDDPETGFSCSGCGEQYKCGECGYEIGRDGTCLRPTCTRAEA